MASYYAQVQRNDNDLWCLCAINCYNIVMVCMCPYMFRFFHARIWSLLRKHDFTSGLLIRHSFQNRLIFDVKGKVFPEIGYNEKEWDLKHVSGAWMYRHEIRVNMRGNRAGGVNKPIATPNNKISDENVYYLGYLLLIIMSKIFLLDWNQIAELKYSPIDLNEYLPYKNRIYCYHKTSIPLASLQHDIPFVIRLTEKCNNK